MIKHLKLKNFTVFKEADLEFSPGLNVIIGENGTGKTHLLKLGYLLSNTWQKSNGNIDSYLSERIRHIFRADKIGSLTTTGSEDGVSQVVAKCGPQGTSLIRSPAIYNAELSIFFTNRSKENFKSTNDTASYSIQHSDDTKTSKKAIYIPSKEMISWFEGFIALYEKREVSFDETYKDLAVNLALQKLKKTPPLLKNALDVLVADVGGTLELDGGKFFLISKGSKRTEVNLVAEGVRKLATLLRLIENGSLEIGDTLFWDEPESNLNSKLVKDVALVLIFLCRNGIQVVIGTHSLFLLREIEILTNKKQFKDIPQRYFALGKQEDSVIVQQGNAVDDINPFVMLDEELAQSDRFMTSDAGAD
jgi:AAA15 family ATPase/GTPase